MNDLSPDARSLLDAARASDRLDPSSRRRIRAGVAAQIAIAAGASVGTTAGASIAEASGNAASTSIAAGLKTEAAAKLSWSLASLSTTKSVAVAAAIAALSTTAAAVNHLRIREAARPTAARAIHAPTYPSRGLAPRALPSPAPPASASATIAMQPATAPTAASRVAKPPVERVRAPVVITAQVDAPRVTVTVSVAPTEAPEAAPEAPAPTTDPSSNAALAASAPETPGVTAPAAPMPAWQCAREIDRALLRGAPTEALSWVSRCRAQIDGLRGGTLGAREVMALCAADRAREATEAARRVLATDTGTDARRRIERTCARGVLRAQGPAR